MEHRGAGHRLEAARVRAALDRGGRESCGQQLRAVARLAAAAALVSTTSPQPPPPCRRVIDSDYSEQESQEFDTEESESEEEGSASESDVDYSASEASSGSEEDEGPAAGEPAALPPYFSAIPSLAGAAPPPPQPKPKPPKAAAPPKAARPQQHAAAPPLAQGSSTAGGPAALTAAAFKRQKVELAAQLFAEFNRTIFEGRLPADLAIKWNGRLLTTAGLTHYRRDIPDDPYAPPM